MVRVSRRPLDRLDRAVEVSLNLGGDYAARIGHIKNN